ncbi:major facilitator superfamily domain-containing protein [Aspergillus cavernicola]|uniref:Major facilitator superfamily domain-containing protein n=1 Tax=Aspergillus cavernicola TaxID=176166 RepID=A0ABR4IMF9_9EURO
MHDLSSSDTMAVDDSCITPRHTSNINIDIVEEPRDSRIAITDGATEGDQGKFATRTESREASTPIAPPLGAPPDGGLRAWSTVVGAFCGMFVSFGWISCIGVFIDYYKAHQLKDVDTSTITWITSLEYFMMFFGGPFVGVFFDNFGPRWILLAGSFFHVFGLMMISISSKYYQFLLAQGICSPIGTSALFHVSLNSVNTWFRHRRALALGITVSGSSFGGIIFPIMMTRLIPILDFGWAMRICAFTSLFLLIITNLTIRSRLTHQRKTPLCQPLDFIRPLRETPFILTSAATFFLYWGLFLPFAFIPTQAQRYGMSSYLASYLLAILNAGSIFGRILPPYLADHLGRYNIMILISLLSLILVLTLWLPSRTTPTAITFAALYGFTSGAAVSLAPALIAQISDIREIGVRSGTYFAIAAFAALTGTPIGGALVPAPLEGSYLGVEVFCAGTMLVGVLIYGVARGIVPNGGWGVRVRV